MKHILYNTTGICDTAVLIKESALRKDAIQDAYISLLNQQEVIAISLDYAGKPKPTATIITAYLNQLMPVLGQCQVQYLICADGEYFKKLTGVKKVDAYYGILLPCKIPNYEFIQVCLVPSYLSYVYSDENKVKTANSIAALNQHKAGTYVRLGTDIVHYEAYPDTVHDITAWLTELRKYPALTADIEAFSLKHHQAGIGTITFCWNEHEGIAFAVDYQEIEPTEIQVWDKKDKKFKQKIAVGQKIFNEPVRDALRQFFETYEGKLIWHRSQYDVVVLIYQLWMEHINDYAGLLRGLEVMTKNMHDSLLVAYLATNSANGNELSLKSLAQEFAGAYAVDEINDIRMIPKKELLRYNLIDGLCTWYVMDKHYPTLVWDEQYQLYHDHFIQYQVDIIQMMLTGIALDMYKVYDAEAELNKIKRNAMASLLSNKYVHSFVDLMKHREVEEYNSTRKVKRITLAETKFEGINPNSPNQVIALVYEIMGLPIIEMSKTKEPSTKGKVLKSLMSHTEDTDKLEALDALVQFALVEKILSSFITVFKEAPKGEDGLHYLFGSFNLGGTVSGRLSSCLVGETMVQCSDGIKRLDEINRGDLVPTHTGKLQPVLNVFNNGTQPVYRITLEDGKQLDCTSNHRLLTENGFLSLEDMFNENAAKIRQRFINGYAASFDGLPQLSVVGIAENSNWKEFKDSSSVSSTCQQRRTCSKENTYKSSYASATLCECTTSRNETLPSKYRVEFGRSSQRCKSTPICTSNLHKGTGGYYSVSESIIPETLLPENTTAPEREGCDQKKGHAKVYRPKGICTSTNSCLDGEREQVQLRAPSSNAKTPRVGSITKWVGGTSCQRGQDRQPSGQLSTDDQFSTHGAPPRKYSPIIKIDYVGVRRVYDLEVEADHCYIANGVYVHNSNPNLQTIPSGSVFAKLIKQCFIAPVGFLFGGADFASLEDRISALTTRDPNKLKVYIDGYDGHSLRAYSYWPECFSYVRQAETERCFKLVIDGDTYYGKAGDTIVLPNGTSLPIEQYYASTSQNV